MHSVHGCKATLLLHLVAHHILKYLIHFQSFNNYKRIKYTPLKLSSPLSYHATVKVTFVESYRLGSFNVLNIVEAEYLVVRQVIAPSENHKRPASSYNQSFEPDQR